MIDRPPIKDHYMSMAHLVSERATCVRRKVGAVIVKDNRVVSTGYNGVPKGMKHCTEDKCIRTAMNIPSGERHELCWGIHAELNAVVFANRYDLEGADIYITTFPCSFCTKVIVNSGIKNIFYSGDYNDSLSLSLLQKSNVNIKKI